MARYCVAKALDHSYSQTHAYKDTRSMRERERERTTGLSRLPLSLLLLIWKRDDRKIGSTSVC